MDLAELTMEVMGKLSAIEGKTYTSEQVRAWHEILAPHAAPDASAAVLAFHSKPFKRPAYPGDLKAHILETEGVRLRRCGTIEANEADLAAGAAPGTTERVRRLIATGEWTAGDYRAYRRSGQSIEEFNAGRGALPVG